MVSYSPEIDASKFTLHILSDTPGGFQSLKYIVLMKGRGGGVTPSSQVAWRQRGCLGLVIL